MKQVTAMAFLAIVLAAGFLVVWLVRRRTGAVPTGPYAVFMGGAYGLLLGLLLFQATGNYIAARNATVTEAATLRSIHAATVGLPSTSRDRIETDVVCLARLIDGAEWALMRQGDLTGSAATRAGFERLGADIAAIPVDEPQQAPHYGAIFTRYLMLNEQHAQTLSLGDSQVPASIWVVVFALAFIIVILIGLQQELRGRRVAVGISALLVVTLALIVYFLSGLDRPFEGWYSVSPPTTLQQLGSLSTATSGAPIDCPR